VLSNLPLENTNAQATIRTLQTNKPKVLIVEDHDDTREMLRVFLEMKSCQVLEACNGQEAVDIAGRELPDLILMDGSLPVMDGLQATSRIRETVRRREVLILALNGWGTKSFHAAALAAGCDDCITKPIDFERIEPYLTPLLNRSTLAAA
jgi:two-component system cell cycle response regulator DivK